MLLAVPFGLGIGLSLGMLGGGGAVLAVPVLVYALGQDVHAATTASLVVVTVAALAGGAGQAREGRICWQHAASLALPAVGGVVIGTLANRAVAGEVLLLGFVPIMLAAAWATWRKGADRETEDRGSGSACPPIQPLRDGSAGFGVGLLTGFFGVGGGFVVVPTLATALKLPLRYAIGTSLFVVVAVSAVGIVSHLIAGGRVEVGVTATLAAGCVVGALAGSALAQRVSQAALARSFALLVTGVAAYLLIATVFLGGPPHS